MDNFQESKIKASDFGKDFSWGISTSAYQIEGAHNTDGKGVSIWDAFVKRKGKVRNAHNGNSACDYYNRFRNDIDILSSLNIPNYRFSISWTRVLPDGMGSINQKGIDFYNSVIDYCLEKNITPWITLYHWDLPLELELRGGWTNRDVVNWFSEYTLLCAKSFGDRIKNWMVLNEPLVSTGAGYFLGIHAPGKKGPGNFLKAVHHTVLCQAEGGRMLRKEIPSAHIGTTFSCAPVQPVNNSEKNSRAAKRMDALLNRLFIEPALGMGYPKNDLPFLKRIEDYFLPDDKYKLQFDFDFIGMQNYTREIVKSSLFTPFMRAQIIPAAKRNVPLTAMGWEIYPESVYLMLKQFSQYKSIKKFIITESGIGLNEQLHNGKVNDKIRINYLRNHITQVLRAKKEGIPVEGFFVWTLLDNFEWAEGYHPRFGLVHVDFETQQRTIKNSGWWVKQFLDKGHLI